MTSKQVVISRDVNFLLSMISRSTDKGRTWLACTIGSRPKIKAVANPMRRPDTSVNASTMIGR